MTAQDDAKDALERMRQKGSLLPQRIQAQHYKDYEAVNAAPHSAAQPAQGGDLLKSYDQMLSLIEEIGIDNPISITDGIRVHLERWKSQRALTGQSVDVEAIKEKTYRHFEEKYQELNVMQIDGDSVLEETIDYLNQRGLLRREGEK